MKKKTLTRKLALNKNTIANLEMATAKGGIITTTETMRLDCPLSQDCLTFDLTNCQTWEFPICEGGSVNVICV